MNKKININPSSTKWLEKDDRVVADYFCDLGFRSLKQILDMRVFDLMNMQGLNAVRVEEVIICLYKWLNPNTAIDEAMSIVISNVPIAEIIGMVMASRVTHGVAAADRAQSRKAVGMKFGEQYRKVKSIGRTGTEQVILIRFIMASVCSAILMNQMQAVQSIVTVIGRRFQPITIPVGATGRPIVIIMSAAARTVRYVRRRYIAIVRGEYVRKGAHHGYTCHGIKNRADWYEGGAPVCEPHIGDPLAASAAGGAVPVCAFCDGSRVPILLYRGSERSVVCLL